jgi:hypothetical protein
VAHKFDRSTSDPYVEAAHEIEQRMVSGTDGLQAGAQTQLFDALSNAVVCALGDVAAAAFRFGVNEPEQLKGLAEAICKCAETTLLSYQGEVKADAALQTLETDPRLVNLPPEQQERLRREIGKTRQLESLLSDTRRLPDLLDLAGEVGLYVPDEVAEGGEIVMTTHPTPTQPESVPSRGG